MTVAARYLTSIYSFCANAFRKTNASTKDRRFTQSALCPQNMFADSSKFLANSRSLTISMRTSLRAYRTRATCVPHPRTAPAASHLASEGFVEGHVVSNDFRMGWFDLDDHIVRIECDCVQSCDDQTMVRHQGSVVCHFAHLFLGDVIFLS